MYQGEAYHRGWGVNVRFNGVFVRLLYELSYHLSPQICIVEFSIFYSSPFGARHYYIKLNCNCTVSQLQSCKYNNFFFTQTLSLSYKNQPRKSHLNNTKEISKASFMTTPPPPPNLLFSLSIGLLFKTLEFKSTRRPLSICTRQQIGNITKVLSSCLGS